MLLSQTSFFTILRLLFGITSVAVLGIANNLLGPKYDYFSLFIATITFYSAFDLGSCVSTAFQYKKTRSIAPVTFVFLIIILFFVSFHINYKQPQELSFILIFCLVDVWLTLIIFNTISASGRLLLGEILRGTFELLRALIIIFIFYADDNFAILLIVSILLFTGKVILISKYVDHLSLKFQVLKTNYNEFVATIIVSAPIGINAIIGTYVILLLKEYISSNNLDLYSFDLAIKVMSFFLIFSTPIFFKYLKTDGHEKLHSEKKLLYWIIIASFGITSLVFLSAVNNYIITLLVFIISFSLNGWIEAYLNAKGKAAIVLIVSVLRLILLVSLSNSDFLLVCCVLTSISVMIIGILEIKNVKSKL